MYLNSPEIVVQPSINDLKKVLGRLARNQVECSKPFVRWMSGTCIETPEVRGATDDDEPFVHTFFTDVSQNPQIVKTMLTLTHSTQKVIFGITRSGISVDAHHQHLGALQQLITAVLPAECWLSM